MKNQVLDWLYPSNLYCACCGDLIDRTMPYSLCNGCVKKINWVSEEIRTDGGEETKAHLFSRGFSCARYDSLTKEILRRFKFEGKADLSRTLGRLMWERLQGMGLEVDCILPVPMHRKKERLRGYNQSTLLAEEISRLWSRQTDTAGSQLLQTKLLLRTKETRAMSALSDPERRVNLQDAFRLSPGGVEKLEGKRILLIDDIFTTGTTADECGRVLLDAGAKEIILLVFASGE